MPRFEVLITGEGLDRAIKALDDVGIPTMGPTFTSFEKVSELRIGRLMLAVVEARTAEDAADRVIDAVRSEVDCAIVGVVPLDLSD
jgi:hypothetical protein